LIKRHPSANGLEILELNPGSRPAPALVYFALSAKDSLTLDPFNQPIAYLQNDNIRLISVTLPYHSVGEDPKEAMMRWAEHIMRDPGFVDEFLSAVHKDLLPIVEGGKVVLSGLSRGGYVAFRLAALEESFESVMAFAPLIDLESLPEFSRHLPQETLDSFALKTYIPQLIGKQVRIHVGNRDQRVGTTRTYQFLEKLVDQSMEGGERSPPVEMLITPSIGYKGHGTSEASFHEGARWIKNILL